jgi:hypothetical protein
VVEQEVLLGTFEFVEFVLELMQDKARCWELERQDDNIINSKF